ncbi:MAG: branched-chain amino acid ABC transporter permease [Clostridia bacterium]|nr:branched-chain amino acid ABC transporter permease [Clostridia bacterium]
MHIHLTAQWIITFASVIAAIVAIIGYIIKGHNWYLKQEKQDKEIASIKEENTLICYALSACLDGLQQLGANHTVPIVKEKLDKYLNQRAHK